MLPPTLPGSGSDETHFYCGRKNTRCQIPKLKWCLTVHCDTVSVFLALSFTERCLICTNNLWDPLQMTQSFKLVTMWTNTIKLSDTASKKKCSLLQEEKQSCILGGNTFFQPDKCFPVVCLPIGSVNTLYGLWQPMAYWFLSKNIIF